MKGQLKVKYNCFQEKSQIWVFCSIFLHLITLCLYLSVFSPVSCLLFISGIFMFNYEDLKQEELICCFAVNIYMHTHIHVYMSMHIYMYMHTHTYLHVYAYIYIWSIRICAVCNFWMSCYLLDCFEPSLVSCVKL